MHFLLGGLKLLKDKRNVPICLFLTGKIQRDWLYKECGIAYEEEDEIQVWDIRSIVYYGKDNNIFYLYYRP